MDIKPGYDVIHRGGVGSRAQVVRLNKFTEILLGKGQGIIGKENFIKIISDRHVKPEAKRERPAIKKIEKKIHSARILEAIEFVVGTFQQKTFIKYFDIG